MKPPGGRDGIAAAQKYKQENEREENTQELDGKDPRGMHRGNLHGFWRGLLGK